MIYRPIISELPTFNPCFTDIQIKLIVYSAFIFIAITSYYYKYHNIYYTLGLTISLFATPIVKLLVSHLLDAPLSTYEDYKLNPEKYRKSQSFWDPTFEIIPIIYMYFISFFFVYLVV